MLFVFGKMKVISSAPLFNVIRHLNALFLESEVQQFPREKLGLKMESGEWEETPFIFI